MSTTVLARTARAAGALSLAMFFATMLCAAMPVVVHAQSSDAARAQARTHFDRGIELFNEGRHDAALAELQRAYDVAPAYPVLYNLGRVHVELGHPVEAARSFERYLAEGGDAIAPARRREVETELERQRQRIGRLRVEANVDGSTISVDGVDVATTPLDSPILLGAGAHTIGVRAPGHGSAVRSVQIAGGVDEVVRVELRREVEARGTLRIRSELPDVLVRIDGVEIGRTPLDATIPVPAGDHDIIGERAGYLDDTRRVHVDDQAAVEVRLRMDLDPGPRPDHVGALRLRVPAVSYELRIDGEERSARGELRLPIGVHVVEIDAAERQPWRGEVHVAPDATVVLAPPLEWTPDVRSDRVGSAGSQRSAGQALTIAGGALLAAGLPLVIWNETEISSTDQRVLTLQGDYATRCATFDPAICPPLRDELERLSSSQNTQDVLRAVSIAATIAGVISASIGVVLWATAPSEAEIDASAHASLRLDLGGLRLACAFW